MGALVCLAMARQALRKDKDVAAFYRNQAGRYDGFRESLLPDRDTFLKYTVPWSRVPTLLKKQPTYALVCVGCGTARDVEFVADHLKTLPRNARVALCDLSPELLAQAKLRVDALGLADRVDLIQCDITAGPAALAKLGLRAKDSAVVTCSYCLTMIPAWRAAVDAMLDLRVYKAWFGLDGVYFNRDQVDYVAARTAPEYYAEARSRVPYTPWYPTRYLFAGRKEA